MSEDSIIYRNTLIMMEDVDTGVLEKSPIVVKCVKLLTNDEAVPAILDVATPSAVKVKEQIKDNNEDNKQNAFNDTDGENEPKLLDTEDEDTLTEDESFQQPQKDQKQECEPASSRKCNRLITIG